MHPSESRRYKSLDRVLLLVADLLRGRKHDRFSAAKRASIGQAAANRLLVAIRRRIPGVEPEMQGRRRTFRMDASAGIKRPSFPAAVSACFAASLGTLFAGSNYASGMREALDHVRRATKRRTSLQHIDRKFGFVPRGGEVALPEQAGRLDVVVDALIEQNRVRVRYQHFSGEPNLATIEPLSIVVYDHQLYVIGRADGRIHPYRFSRILELEVEDEKFEYPSPAEYSLEQVFQHSFGIFVGQEFPVCDVEVKLTKRWSTFAKCHRWHRSQELSFDTDGVRVRLHVRVCPELKAWIKSFGDEIEVLAPPELRRWAGGGLEPRSRTTHGRRRDVKIDGGKVARPEARRGKSRR